MTNSTMNGPIPANRFLPFFDWQTLRDLPQKEEAVIILPVGATEQHGPHLPVYVDTIIPTEIVGQALQQLEPETPAYGLPPVWCGKSCEHGGFAGTISLRSETLAAVLMDIGESIYQSGFRKLVLANGHGGQPQVLEIVARELRVHHPDLAVFPWSVWAPAPEAKAHLCEREANEGMHAGTAETSLMMALMGDFIDEQRFVTEYPPDNGAGFIPEGDLPFAWLTRDLSLSGVVGDAVAADLASGERMRDQLVSGWMDAIRRVHRFHLPNPSDRD
jgi:creatinine amidohydrolase